MQELVGAHGCWMQLKTISCLFLLLGAFVVLGAQGTRMRVAPAAAGGVTWTLIQHIKTVNCGNTSPTCSIGSVTTTAGDLLILAATNFDNAVHDSFSSASGDSSWTHCPASAAAVNYTSTDWVVTDCALSCQRLADQGLLFLGRGLQRILCHTP